MAGRYSLGRVVQHDPRSRQFPFKAAAPQPLVSTRHNREIPVLDQGQLGACTGYASVGALGSDPFFSTVKGQTLDKDFAVKVYSLATTLDNVSGSYPPTDTGSSGIGAAKALQKLGLISGYTHTFSFNDLCQALLGFPVIIGVNWYENFFYPDTAGNLSIGNSKPAGGHEIVCDELDVENQRLGFTNSWGTSWGLNGRFFVDFTLMQRLLSEDGDATVFVPLTQAPPVPQPVEKKQCWFAKTFE